MKRILSTVFVLLIFIGCQQPNKEGHEQFKGELFLKLIDIGPEIYTLPSLDGSTLQELFESTPKSELDEEQLEGLKLYEILKHEDLLDKPYFNFTEYNSKNEFVKVLLSNDEYEKIKHFNLSELRKSKDKVKIQFSGIRLNEYLIICVKIEEAKKVRGKQKWKK